MRLLLLAVCLTFNVMAHSKVQNDTIGIDQREITRWIEDPYVKPDGKKSIRYYAIWKGFLLTTSKTTVERAKLCSKYGAKCALIVIGQKQSDGSFKPKRISTN